MLPLRYETPDWFEYGAAELSRRDATYAPGDGVACFAVITNGAYTREEVTRPSPRVPEVEVTPAGLRESWSITPWSSLLASAWFDVSGSSC